MGKQSFADYSPYADVVERVRDNLRFASLRFSEDAIGMGRISAIMQVSYRG